MSSDLRTEELTRAKEYLRLHGLPAAVEEALLRVVPMRHPHPYEVLNQMCWLQDDAPSVFQQRLQSLCRLVRWLRDAERHRSPAAAAPSCGSGPVPMMTIDELIRLQTAARVQSATDGLEAPPATRVLSLPESHAPAAEASPCPQRDAALMHQLQQISAAAESSDLDLFGLVVDPFLRKTERLVAEETPVDEAAVVLAFLFFERQQLPRRLHITDEILLSWLLRVYLNHHSIALDGPFFNFYQSLGILHRCYLCVSRQLPTARPPLSADALFALFVAAISSFVHHPGLLTNDEMTHYLHPLSGRYNDVAPIEQNAASVAFALLEFGQRQRAELPLSSAPNSAELALLSFLDDNPPSYLGQKPPVAGRSARYADFRRCVLRLMLAPAGASAAPAAAAPLWLEDVYLAAYHGWCQGPGPSPRRWRDLLRLQALRHSGATATPTDDRITDFERRAEWGLKKSLLSV
jgi:hypothetical protein